MISDKEYLKKCISTIKRNPQVSEDVIEFFESPRPKYIYGADVQASVCLGMFRDMKLPIYGLVADASAQKGRLKGYWGELLRKTPLYRTYELPDKEHCDLLLTVDRSLYKVCIKMLTQEGFEHIYVCDWGSNTNIKEACLSVYLEELMQ